MDYNGARPKEKNNSSRRSGRNTKEQHLEYQIPSEEGTSRFVKHLSVRLCEVLDKVGASAETRKLRQDNAISREIIMTLCLNKPNAYFGNPSEEFRISRQYSALTAETIKTYLFGSIQSSNFIFGSSSEGTTTPGMNSDTDVLTCHDYISLVDNISESRARNSLLMIRDKHTKPGYVKLQQVVNGQPQTVNKNIGIVHEYGFDCGGRICLKHYSELGKDNLVDERNGPADTATTKNQDTVDSLRCSKMHESSTEWIVRKRHYKWPSKRMLDKMVAIGCFVVGVGHPYSKERHLEWRLSFSLQERELMFSMNIVQHKCYILLKLIKKDLMEPVIGKSISSYHMKTCMFYVIENTKAKLWKRSNLVQCVFLCLRVLFKWVLEGYCPNFFIKDENMFDRAIHRTQRENIVQHLKHLLSNGCEIIFLIKLDCIGALLMRVESNTHIDSELLKSKFKIVINTVIFTITYNTALNMYTLNKSQTPLKNLEYLHTYHKYLSQTKCIKDHTEQQTQEAFSYIIPYVHLQLAHAYASLALRKDEFRAKYRLHLDQARHCDLTSSRLLEVTILYKLEQYEPCFLIINQLVDDINRTKLPVCRCDSRLKTWVRESVKELNNLTVTAILSRTSTCMLFLRSDTAIIPEALQYEMYRSVGSPHGSRNEHFDHWMDLAAVDAVIYLLFIQYLISAKFNQLTYTRMYRLESILKDEGYLVHLETGYNLLGWICLKKGWTRPGIEYFRTSWSIRPHNNAAKFHIMFYIFGERNCKM